MQRPESFDRKVLRIFGDRGRDWLSNVDQIRDACIRKWNLTNCTLSSELSMNLVYFADSPEHGQVALKIGVPHGDLFTEMKALALYNGRHICKCFAVDEELGALLLERFTPGVNLYSVTNLLECVQIGANLIAKLPIEAQPGYELPRHVDWVREAFAAMREKNVAGERMLALVQEAEMCYSAIDVPERPRMLLHGDLHHLNILKTQDGWKAIDPKGVIGAACLDAGRFIEMQLEVLERQSWREWLDVMTAVFSEKLGESRKTIAACVLIDRVLGTSWKFLEYANPGDLSGDVDDCEFFAEYMRCVEE